MKLFIIASFAACIVTLNGQPITESEDTVADAPGEYSFVKTAVTWPQADHACKQWGGQLVTIMDAKQNAYILGELARRWMGGSWMGYNDRAAEGKWTWLYGNGCANYKNWKGGEPNGHRRENCGEIVHGWGWKGQWNDLGCNQKRSYICHKVGAGNGCGHVHEHSGGHWEKTIEYYDQADNADDNKVEDDIEYQDEA